MWKVSQRRSRGCPCGWVSLAGPVLQHQHRSFGSVTRYVEPLDDILNLDAQITDDGDAYSLLELVERHQPTCRFLSHVRLLLANQRDRCVVGEQDSALVVHELVRQHRAPCTSIERCVDRDPPEAGTQLLDATAVPAQMGPNQLDVCASPELAPDCPTGHRGTIAKGCAPVVGDLDRVRDLTSEAGTSRIRVPFLVARFDVRLNCAKRTYPRVVVGLDVERDGQHFQYFECWTSRNGEIAYGDWLKLVAAALAAVVDRLTGNIEALADPRVPIIVPIEAHPPTRLLDEAISDAVRDLFVASQTTIEPPIIHSVELPNITASMVGRFN